MADGTPVRRSVRSAVHLFATITLFGLLAVGFFSDGRLQVIALTLVPVWLLSGLLFAGVTTARETGRLFHHLVFAVVVIGGAAAGSTVWQATHGPLPVVLALGLGFGVWVGVLWAGARIVYGGPFDTARTRVDTLVQRLR